MASRPVKRVQPKSPGEITSRDSSFQRKRTLWPHQEVMLDYCTRTDCPAMFVEMRLGKTLAAIRSLGRYGKYLVAGPSSVIPVWEKELQMEGRTKEEILNLCKLSKQQRVECLDNLEEDSDVWVLINKEAFLAVGPELCTQRWDAIILDESTFIKSPKSRASKFYRILGGSTSRRFILTGTPAPESPQDYFQQFAFLHDRFMGFSNFYHWRQHWFRPGLKGEWFPKPEFTKALRKEIASLALVLGRKDAGLYLPKVYETRFVEFPQRRRKMYLELEKNFETEDGKELKYSIQVFTSARRMTSGVLIMPVEVVWDGKITELVELLKGELKGHPVVVWFCFNDTLRAVQTALAGEGIKCGLVFEGWLADLDEFQKGRRNVLLCQIAMASMGVDLSRASASIYFEQPVKALERTQSEERILHPNKKEASLILDLIVPDTVDEDIHQAMKEKKFGQYTVLNAVKRAAERRRKANV